ncbi:MAG: DUF3696 domain-containing protein [Candidatus Poribacteria bacterium]|nr:DUF3696 domain-containing protein [Candidatus Poribacteria bacterium]
MLHALELENFKAFGERARIPFAPITLIFGENSAGKSTILQALYLLKQTLEGRDTGAPLLPRADSGIVDLGSFQEMLFDHDLERRLSIRVDTKLDQELGIEFSFKRPSPEEEVLLDQIGIYDGKSSKCLAKFQPLALTEKPKEFTRRRFLSNSRSISVSKLAAVKCVWLAEAIEHWIPEFEWCIDNKEKIRNLLEEKLVDLEQHSEGIREGANSFKDDMKFLLSNFDLETYVSRRRDEEMNTVLDIQGFFPVEIMTGKRSPWIDEVRFFFHRRADEFIIFDVAQLVMWAASRLGLTLEALFPMSPFRKPPERWYIFSGTSPSHVGYQGDLLPDLLLRRPKLVDETNEWLKRLEIDYELEVKPVGTDSSDLFAVRLIDTRRKERVSIALSDVGFGVSQLLPFIVQSLVAEEQIISIEQPEVHVHPRLQADLGDLLAAAIKKENPNQFLVETHSEHLILRLQRLVYEKRIQPEDVSVIYVSRGPEGAKAERLRLDEEGDFIDEWPDGFFPERLRELR